MDSIISMPETVAAARLPLSRIMTRVALIRFPEMTLDTQIFPARAASPTALNSGE